MVKKPGKYASLIEKRRKPLKDIDGIARARFIKAAVWLIPMGVLMFLFITFAAVEISGLSLARAMILGLLLGLCGPFAVYTSIQLAVVRPAVFFINKLYGVTGATQLSTSWRGQALAAHGSFEEAMDAFEAEVARYPNDPGPCLRAAAVCIEERDDPEAAVSWFHRARNARGLTPETDAYISVRLADLYETMGEHAPALVELRRLLQMHQNSPYAKTARNRLAELKAAQIAKHQADQNG
jgi:hypothetical protein